MQQSAIIKCLDQCSQYQCLLIVSLLGSIITIVIIPAASVIPKLKDFIIVASSF